MCLGLKFSTNQIYFNRERKRARKRRERRGGERWRDREGGRDREKTIKKTSRAKKQNNISM